jgi:hypothetical protein
LVVCVGDGRAARQHVYHGEKGNRSQCRRFVPTLETRPALGSEKLRQVLASGSAKECLPRTRSTPYCRDCTLVMSLAVRKSNRNFHFAYTKLRKVEKLRRSHDGNSGKISMQKYTAHQVFQKHPCCPESLLKSVFLDELVSQHQSCKVCARLSVVAGRSVSHVPI